MTLRVERYTEQQKARWDDFVRRSKNGTFLFQRDYMDYHRDRFTDHSLMIYDGDQVVALLPANQNGTTLSSHGGLTYGGFLTDDGMKLPLMLEVFAAALPLCRQQGFTHLRYKTIPYIYHRVPAQEDLYALYLGGARVAERNALTVCGQGRLALQERRQRGTRKAERAGVQVGVSEDFETYWRLLAAALEHHHNARPVHTLSEMLRLHEKFHSSIRLYGCFEVRTMIAGVLIFETAFVARAQYIAANARGRELAALDLLFDYLLGTVYDEKPYFDFGTSHDPATHSLNLGLIDQKEGFGGRTVTQDTYLIDLERWNRQALEQAVT